MSMLATALLIVACGQADRLTRPGGESAGVPAPHMLASTVNGCGRIRVHVQCRDSITTDVTAEIEGQCDSLQIVVAGTPTFDRVAQQVALPLALKNTSHRKLKPPTWLAIDVDSITVLFPTGITQNAKRVYVDLPAPDSVGTPGGPVPGASVWGYDTLLVAAPGPQVLPA